MFQSVITYRQDNSNSTLPILKPKLNPNIELRKSIVEKYQKESPYVVGVISVLLNSIDLIRKCNFNNWNIKNV